ncbi:class I SAM-dependent methyltransferase [Rhizobium sp. P40RR-XXII]|uniref:class I SAM-dependent methyltransferase n=1 Tax=Rhizobium sp. P40RR-XXII TaxID=2726739 RepID=UPI001456EF9E|nr:class I SAM-dependent methyltransferase [Rhizobium sp. P40RR-XXII]NLS20376.1 class I SAM-dependent methyltransferase [Rhizobium sp. P40RR-XXII]
MTIVNRQPYRLAVKALEVQASDRVLELGFGAGRSLARLCRLAANGKVVAIEHSEAMLTMARRKNRRQIAAGRLDLQAGRFSPLEFPEGFFDRILLVNVIYFFDRAGRDIAECYRVLRSGGRIAMYATDKETMKRWPFCEEENHRIFGPDDIVEMLASAGFMRDDMTVEPVPLPFGIRGLVVGATKR